MPGTSNTIPQDIAAYLKTQEEKPYYGLSPAEAWMTEKAPSSAGSCGIQS